MPIDDGLYDALLCRSPPASGPPWVPRRALAGPKMPERCPMPAVRRHGFAPLAINRPPLPTTPALLAHRPCAVDTPPLLSRMLALCLSTRYPSAAAGGAHRPCLSGLRPLLSQYAHQKGHGARCSPSVGPHLPLELLTCPRSRLRGPLPMQAVAACCCGVAPTRAGPRLASVSGPGGPRRGSLMPTQQADSRHRPSPMTLGP